jgi:hypothetical protein
MFTSWKSPNSVRQFAEHENHVAWDNTDGMSAIKSQDARSLKTVDDLIFIANPTVNNIRNKTWYIVLTDFRFSENINEITGLQLRFNCQRHGRVTDDTIQLYWQENAIGENIANMDLDLIKTYGISAYDWGLENFEKEQVLSSEFGVLLRFQSHPFWPHRSAMFINSVDIRLSYI